MKYFIAVISISVAFAAQAQSFEFNCAHTRTTEEVARLGQPFKRTVLTVINKIPSLSTDAYGISEIDQKTLNGGWLSYQDYMGSFVSTEGETFICYRPEI